MAQFKLRVQSDRFIPNVRASELVEYFLISAISSLLIIRAYLYFTNYPQLGGGNLHIAHMLWGGVLMFIALMLLFGFLGRGVRTVAAVVGGIGFGTFIDELGKFITSDNNYFYEPTIAIIYVVFILIFFFARYIERFVTYTPKTYTINALEYLQEVVRQDFDETERSQTMKLLSLGNRSDPLVKDIENIVSKAEYKKKKPTLIEHVLINTKQKASQIVRSSVFKNIVICYFILQSVVIGIMLTAIVISKTQLFGGVIFLISVIISVLFAYTGIYFLFRKQPKTAYRMFITSLLISIFITQFFLFLDDQLASINTLVVNIVMYVTLKYAIIQMEVRKGVIE